MSMHARSIAAAAVTAMFMSAADAQVAESKSADRPIHTLGAPMVWDASVLPGLTLPRGSSSCPEVELLNYTITGQTAAVPGFGQGEECAVILQAPADHYPIEIMKIRIGWSSIFGNTGQVLQDALRIYPNGLPNPGNFQYEVLGPVLTDGGINEFDLLSVPGNGSRIINSGPFTVSIRIAETMQVTDAAPNHDANGCQFGKNAVLVNGETWFDFCALGGSGDWVMSVLYRQVDCSGGVVDCNDNGVNDADEIFADPSLDCNSNGVLDSCEIEANPSLDQNGNGVLDACEPACNGELTGDNVVNGADLATVLANWGPCPGQPCNGELTGDNVVNGADLATVLANWGPCGQ